MTRFPDYLDRSEAFPERPLGAALLDVEPEPYSDYPLEMFEPRDAWERFWEEEEAKSNKDLGLNLALLTLCSPGLATVDP